MARLCHFFYVSKNIFYKTRIGNKLITTMVVANNSDQKGSSTTVIRRSSQTKNRINGNTSGAPSNNDVGTAVVAISPRKSEFSKSTWWMVDLNNQSVISNRQGATPLVARCQREYLWDEAKCRRVLNAYRQFLELKKIFEDWDATILSPSQVVDQMWHQHLLDVTNYCHDTILLCGHVVGHNPDGALDGPAKAARTQTTRDALFDNFGSDYNKEMWLTPTELHEEERIDSKILITLISYQTGGKRKKKLFRLRRHQKLSVLFNTYAQMTGVAVHKLNFLLDGERIPESLTPFDLELDDQDQIDVMLVESGC